MERGTEPGSGGAASSSKSADSRKQSADGVHAERDSTASTPLVRALGPKRPRVTPRGSRTAIDVPTASDAHARRQASVETATDDLALVAPSSRRTNSAATRRAADEIASAAGADARQPHTVAPIPAEAHLFSTRSKTTTLGGEAEAPRRSSRSRKKRRKSSSKSSTTGSVRDPTETATTTASERRPSAAATTTGFTSSLETSIIADFAPVICDLATEVVALYGGDDAAAGTRIDTASATFHRRSSAMLAPDDSAGPADKASVDAPQDGDDTATVTQSSSRKQRVVQPALLSDAGAVDLEDRDAAGAPLDQKQADAAATTTHAQEDLGVLPSSVREDKDADTAKQDTLAAHPAVSGIAVPVEEPVQQVPPAVSAAASAPPPMRQQLVQGQASGGAPKRRKGTAQSKDVENSRLMSRGSDDRAVSSHEARRSAIGSPSQWSFYPLNVTFVTELDSKQERLMYGGVICSIALVGSVLLGAVIALLYGTRVPSPLACVTPQCVAARDYLSGLLNTSRDACSDFYGYVCSSWIVHGQDDGGSFRADSIATTLVKINNHLWRREDADDDPTDLRLMRRVYQKCHRYTADGRDERSFKGTLESARKHLNWAPIRGSRVYRDLVALLVRTSLLLGFHTVVAIQLLSEDTHVLLRLSCGQSLLRKLTTTGEQWNLEATLRIVNYDAGELSKILAIDESVHGHLERRCAGNAGQHDVTKTLDEILDDLVPGVNATEWISAVDEVLADSGYNRSHLFDVGLASGADGFRVAFHEVTASDGGVETAAMYVASHLDAEILSMELSRNRLPMNPVETAQFCLALARKPVSFSWPRLLARILELHGSKEVLVTMFEYLRETASRTTVFTWLAKVMPRVAEKRIQKVDLAVVSEDMTPKSARTARVTETAPLAADFEQRNASFVELFVQAMAFVHGRLVRNPPTQQEFIVAKLELLDELAYSEETSSVVVPTLYQRVPHFYAVDVPPYFNYATVGALMATRISEAVGPALTAAKETKGPGRPVQDVWWTRAAMRQYNVTAQCLERLHGRLGLRHKANGGSTAAVKRRDMVLRAQGLRLAYDALVESFGIASASKEFRNLWPEAQAIFFARFCLLSCDADHQSPKPVLSSRANCLLPLHNMPEFGTVFDCGSREDFVAEQCLA